MGITEKVVSSDSEQLILVDRNDREQGFLDKAACHDGAGILHRAFSVFLFNGDGQLLLQQRAAGKRLWPNYWSNSCCSHPREGESMAEATLRRIDQELGIRASVEFIYKFSYQAEYEDLGAEHELCWVFLGRSDAKIHANSNEIAAVRFVEPDELTAELAEDAESFTPWLRMEWQRLRDEFSERLSFYATPVDEKIS